VLTTSGYAATVTVIQKGTPVNAFLLAAAVLSLAALPPAVDEKFSGEWKIRNDIASNVSEFTCAFTQKAAELTGGCSTEQGPVEITGSVEDTSINWVFKSVYNGGPITLTYRGSLGTDGTIAGSVTVEEFSVTGDWSATPVTK
jgi:hypothetical protein